MDTPERQFVLGSFRVLDPNAIFNVLRNMEPRDVLSLCVTSSKWNELCSKIPWDRMLEIHYPKSGKYGNLRDHYNRLTFNKCQQYILVINKNGPSAIENIKITDRISKLKYKESVIGVLLPHQYKRQYERKASFKVCGNKRPGIWIVLYIYVFSNTKPKDTQAFPFNSREDAIDFTVNESWKEINNQYSEYLENENLKDVLGWDRPVTKENLKYYVDKYQMMYMPSFKDTEEWYQIIYVSLPQ